MGFKGKKRGKFTVKSRWSTAQHNKQKLKSLDQTLDENVINDLDIASNIPQCENTTHGLPWSDQSERDTIHTNEETCDQTPPDVQFNPISSDEVQSERDTNEETFVQTETRSPDVQFKTLAMHLKITSSNAVVIDHSEINIIKHNRSGEKTIVQQVLTVKSNYEAVIHVHQRRIPDDHEIWNGLPQLFETPEAVNKLLERLSNYSVCVGNPDENFQGLVPIGSGLSDNKSSTIYAYREGDFCSKDGYKEYNSTIRSTGNTFFKRQK